MVRSSPDPTRASGALAFAQLALVRPWHRRNILGCTDDLTPEDGNEGDHIERGIEYKRPDRRDIEYQDQKDEAISPEQQRDQRRHKKDAAEQDIEDQPREALVSHVPERRGYPATLNSRGLTLR